MKLCQIYLVSSSGKSAVSPTAGVAKQKGESRRNATAMGGTNLNWVSPVRMTGVHMSTAKEMTTSSKYFTMDSIYSKAVKRESIQERFPGAEILTFEDNSCVLVKPGKSGVTYITVIGNIEALK